jgi:hypothetical protein
MPGQRPTQNESAPPVNWRTLRCEIVQLSDYGARNKSLVSRLSDGSQEPGSDQGVHTSLSLFHGEASLMFNRRPDIGVELQSRSVARSVRRNPSHHAKCIPLLVLKV